MYRSMSPVLSLPNRVCNYVCVHIGHCQLAKLIANRAVSALHPLVQGRSAMPKRRREETEDAECSPLTDGALKAKILELVHKRGLTKTC